MELITVARAYIASEISVIPVRDKRPTGLKEWKAYQNKLPTEQEISKWWGPAPGIATLTGNGHEEIDFDFKGEFIEVWAALVKREAPDLLKRLRLVSTISGGYHAGFRCPMETPGNAKLAAKRVKVGGAGNWTYLGPGQVEKYDKAQHKSGLKAVKEGTDWVIYPVMVETRGAGGYTVAPPTAGYKVVKGVMCEWPQITPDERNLLIRCAQALDQRKQAADGHKGLSPLDDYHARATASTTLQLLKDHGAAEAGTVGTDVMVRRPGKDTGHSGVVHPDGIFVNFSGNWTEFDLNRGDRGVYGPAAVYAILEHGGNFKAAARELARQGFGDRKPTTATVEPEPVPTAKTLTFPYGAIQGAAGAFADTYSKYVEAPREFLFMGYLTALGAVLSKNLTLASVLDTQPRLFTALVGESATDRKSTTLKIISRHFKSVLDGFFPCLGVNSAEGLQNLLKRKKGREWGLLLMFDELKSFVSKCKIDSSVLLPAVNQLFENNDYHANTKKVSIEIEDGYLSLLAASTLETYERIYTPAFIDIGFPNRVFLVVGTAERRFSVPPQMGQEDEELLKDNLVELLRHVGTGMQIGLTREAAEIHHQWYMNRPKSVHAKRLSGYALRLMMLLAVNDFQTEISIDTVKQAHALCDWQLEVRKAYDPIDADNVLAKVEEKIRRVLRAHGILKPRELKQRINYRREGIRFYEQAVRNLQQQQEIGWSRKKKAWIWGGE